MKPFTTKHLSAEIHEMHWQRGNTQRILDVINDALDDDPEDKGLILHQRALIVRLLGEIQIIDGLAKLKLEQEAGHGIPK